MEDVASMEDHASMEDVGSMEDVASMARDRTTQVDGVMVDHLTPSGPSTG